ncbi:hypothetical protein CLAIMM_02350 isoform 2 [Cladophialophora immunda]|nr:hypothetical protein CLAIMM_02350 isoform 1 [Cladophialophora immunda]OQU96242.1 hypothetical protein CLAIMM_02350 isoform 2 [Cladophialophora immunda]
MDIPESYGVGRGMGSGERANVDGALFLLNTPNPRSATSEGDEVEPWSAVSPACFSPSLDPQLKHVLEWAESPSLTATTDYIEFPLAPPQFEELKKLEQLGLFCGENFRYDYSEADEILAFRMAGGGHEWIKGRLTMKISQGLADAAARDDNSHSAREFALLPTSLGGSSLLNFRSSTVADKKERRSPDAQFLSDRSRRPWLPSLIIEVAWTQTTKSLEKLAYEYIRGSNGRIRTVIGFDVNPSARKGATVYVWRAVFNQDNIAVACDSTEIRSVSGIKNPDPQAGLRLTLEDFAYSRNPEEYPDLDAVVIFIPVDDLYEILEEAEAAQEGFRGGNQNGSSASDPSPPAANTTASHGYSLRSQDGHGV